ncbi:MAG: GNAT family N-acetyltransferase [Bacteroidota bacterium]
MKLKLEKAREKDLGYLLRLRKSTMLKHLKDMGIELTDEKHRASILRDFEHAHLLRIDDRTIGLLKYVETDKFIDIKQLQIDPSEQGKGFGKLVLEYFIRSVEKDHKFLKLKVLKKNPAKRLYERMGFQTYDEDVYEYFMRR